MQTTLPTRTRPGAGRIFGIGTAAAALAVVVNVALRAGILAVLSPHALPFPLAPGADIVFTFVPGLLGTALYLVLRRRGARPVRRFAVIATVVVVISWVGPVVLVPAGVVTVPVMLGLMVMHAVPAAVLVAAFRWVDRPTG